VQKEAEECKNRRCKMQKRKRDAGKSYVKFCCFTENAAPANAFLHRALSFYHIPFRRSAISSASGVLLPKKPCNPAQRLV
jgi:hypothetical protein